MANTPKAIAFTQAARDAAGASEIAYRRAKRLTQIWTASDMNLEFVLNDATIVEDGNLAQPLTHQDVRAVWSQLNDIVLDFEANNNRKLNVCIRANNIPGDWR